MEGFPEQEMKKVKGQLTAMKVKILDAGNTNWVYTVNYYDMYYRMIQQQKRFIPRVTELQAVRMIIPGRLRKPDRNNG